jgi:hypothetical protein
VGAILQVAGDLRLLGFRSAAAHRVQPPRILGRGLSGTRGSESVLRDANAT